MKTWKMEFMKTIRNSLELGFYSFFNDVISFQFISNVKTLYKLWNINKVLFLFNLYSILFLLSNSIFN
jgi:hypothetical protein